MSAGAGKINLLPPVFPSSCLPFLPSCHSLAAFFPSCLPAFNASTPTVDRRHLCPVTNSSCSPLATSGVQRWTLCSAPGAKALRAAVFVCTRAPASHGRGVTWHTSFTTGLRTMLMTVTGVAMPLVVSWVDDFQCGGWAFLCGFTYGKTT
jgi:hypothetical protein